MRIFFIIVGFLLIADALFVWANFNKVNNIFAKFFPQLGIKWIALGELIVGAVIIYSQV